MFHLELSTREIRLINDVRGAAYQAARWIKQFHEARYLHIGWMDHGPDTHFPDLLNKYGFIRVPCFELNSIRMHLQTHGPMLVAGAFSHLPHNQRAVPVPEMRLWAVSHYEQDDHAILLNGYWDGFQPKMLYRDPAYPEIQFVAELGLVRDRMDAQAGLFYLNCPAFPKPCRHVPRAPISPPADGAKT